MRAHHAPSLSARTPRIAITKRLSFLLLLAFCLGFSAVGCPCIRGPVNASPGLRFWLFSSFGASRVCPEMLKSGVPLKVPPLGNASVGRFFPESCEATVDDARQTLTVKLAGTGYATLPVARRLGFSCAVTVEYAPDFYLAEDDSIYVWGKFVRLVSPPELRIVGVENPVVQLATQTPLGSVATLVGEGLVSGEIGKGFTVVRQDDGDDFVLGHLDPPAKPVRTARASRGHVLLASDLLELRAATREYAGPFEIREGGKALFLRAHVQGVPLVFSVVDRPSGDAWSPRSRYGLLSRRPSSRATSKPSRTETTCASSRCLPASTSWCSRIAHRRLSRTPPSESEAPIPRPA